MLRSKTDGGIATYEGIHLLLRNDAIELEIREHVDVVNNNYRLLRGHSL